MPDHRKDPCAGCGRFPPQPRKHRKAARRARRGEVPTGDVIRFIGSDGVRLYSPSRNAEWTLPYSGDDI